MRARSISIITVCKNAADTIGDTLQSVAGQTFSPVQHIVVDGASADDTLAVVERLGDHVDTVVSRPDRGIYQAINTGLGIADGDLVGILHADDHYTSPRVLEKIVALHHDSGAQCVWGDLVYVDRRDPTRIVRTWPAGDISRRKLTRGWIPPHPSFFATREICEAVGPYDTGLELAADYDWMLTALLDLGASTAYLPETLIAMRAGGASNRSIGQRVRAHLEDRRVMRRHGIADGGLRPLLKPLLKIPQFF